MSSAAALKLPMMMPFLQFSIVVSRPFARSIRTLRASFRCMEMSKFREERIHHRGHEGTQRENLCLMHCGIEGGLLWRTEWASLSLSQVAELQRTDGDTHETAYFNVAGFHHAADVSI